MPKRQSPLASFLLFVVTVVVIGAGCAHREVQTVGEVRVHSVRIDSTNVGVIEGAKGIVLVDIGLEGAFEKLEPALIERGVDAKAITRLILTHAHGDHAGDAAAVQGAGIPVWLHSDDVPMMAAGVHDDFAIYGCEAHILHALLDASFPPGKPDEVFGEEMVLDEVNSLVIPVGGHTSGSAVVVVDERVAFVGDLIRGGYLGGLIAGGSPKLHYFHANKDRSHQALQELLDRFPKLHTIWPAHGNAFSRADLAAFLKDQGTGATSD